MKNKVLNLALTSLVKEDNTKKNTTWKKTQKTNNKKKLYIMICTMKQ
jgi:hypothetical protein